MGKRSDFDRIDRDCYDTQDIKAILPLLPFISGDFVEPCAGNGTLVKHLEHFGMRCVSKTDIVPRHPDIAQVDAMSIRRCSAKIITNPPWQRQLKGDDGKLLPPDQQPLHMMIKHFVNIAPSAWLLFDADWAHTVQAVPYLKYCSRIVSVGRVKWFEGTSDSGKENCAWYLFQKGARDIEFTPRRV